MEIGTWAAKLAVIELVLVAIIMCACTNKMYIKNDKLHGTEVGDKNPPTHKHYVRYVEYKAPTCTQEGNKEYWHCNYCEKYYVDENLEKEESKERIKLPATGHEAETIAGEEPTCEESGWTEGERCKVCGEELKEREEVKSKGHSYENGKCADCGKQQASEGLKIKLERDELTLTGIGACEDKNIVIPDEVDGVKVTKIGENAFVGENIERISLGKWITEIGESAFESCYELTEVTLNAELKTVGYGAFQDCKSLEGLEFASVKAISESAFMSAGIKQLTLPEGLETIGEMSFGCCEQLTRITLPSTLKELSPEAFLMSGLQEIEYAGPREEWRKITGAEEFREQNPEVNITYNERIFRASYPDVLICPFHGYLHSKVSSCFARKFC